MANSQLLATALLVGIGATAVTDLWTVARQRAFGVPPPNYGLVGRWIAHMRHGRFRHHAIAATPAVRGERILGWSAHYLIGIAFAAMFLFVEGPDWFFAPRLAPALLFGLGTVAAPFLILQPGMGAGIAARRTPRPWIARAHSVLMHLAFGLGLYLASAALGPVVIHA